MKSKPLFIGILDYSQLLNAKNLMACVSKFMKPYNQFINMESTETLESFSQKSIKILNVESLGLLLFLKGLRSKNTDL